MLHTLSIKYAPDSLDVKKLRRKKRKKHVLKLPIDGIIRTQLLPGEGYNPTYVWRKVVILIQVFQNLFE